MSAPMSLRARIGASIGDVRRSLTDAAAMRVWLAEHAVVELPHRYEFWGRYTPAGTIARQRLLYVDEHTLSFTWELGGEETVVQISLEVEGPDSTIVSLSQSDVPESGEYESGSRLTGVLPAFWALAIANLADYVEGREPTPMCDFATTELRAQVVIDASPDDVFHSLTAPEVFRQWFGASMEIEPYIGGRWAMGGFEVAERPAKIIELNPGSKIVMDWGAFISTWELEGTDGGTRLTFVHSGFDDREPPLAGWLGWLAGIAQLRRFEELGGVPPIQLSLDAPNMHFGCVAAS